MPDTFNSWAGAKEQRGPGTDYPSLGTRNLSVEDLLNAAKALRAQQEGPDAFPSENAHQNLFESALVRGELDPQLVQWHSEGSDAPIDIPRLRRNAHPTDFDSVPIADALYDVRNEDYNVYNAVNQNPKTQYFFEQHPLVLANPEQLHLDIVRHLQQLPATERHNSTTLLTDLVNSGESRILSGAGHTADTVAHIVNIAGTENTQIPRIQNVYGNVRESLDEVGPFVNQAIRDSYDYNVARDNLEVVVDKIKAAKGIQEKDVSYKAYTPKTGEPRPRNAEYAVGRGRPTADDLYYEAPYNYERGTGKSSKVVHATQPALPFDVIPKEAENATQLLTQNDSFANRVDIEDRTVALRKAAKNITREYNRTLDNQELGTDAILNEIVDKFGEHDAKIMLQKAQYNEQRAISSEAVARREAERAEDSLRSVVFTPQSDLNVADAFATKGSGDVKQPVITGLREQMMLIASEAPSKEKRQALVLLDEALQKYPEVKNLYESSPLDIARPAAAGKDTAKRYDQYIDTQQRVSLPEERAALYNRIRNEKGLEPSVLSGIESAYTSGNTAKQQEAILALSSQGYDELGAMGSSATSSRKPIIGGERYVGFDDIRTDSEAESILDHIRTRANTINRIVQKLDLDVLEERYPRFKGDSAPSEFRYTFDPLTRQVEEVPLDTKGTYGVKIHRTGGADFELLRSVRGEENASLNVLKFLRDNPVVGEASSISFQTKTPTESYNYVAKQLPKEISDVFQQEISRSAVAGLRPGTILSNSPNPSRDYIENKQLTRGSDSATVRKAENFTGLPYNKRGAAYTRAGFGPTSDSRHQYLYVTPEGTALALQQGRPERALAGSVKFNNQGEAFVSQSRVPLTSKAYYATDPVTAAARGATDLLHNIKPKHVAGGLLGDAAINFALGESPTSAAASAVVGPIESTNTSALERVGPQGQFVDTRSNTVLNNGRYTNQGLAYREGKPVLVQRGSVAGEATVMDQAKSALGHARNVNAARVNRVTNEAKYVLNNLLGGRLPYGR